MLSIIVVDYNSIEKTLGYISHLREKIRCKGEIHFIVVDNYSNINDINMFVSGDKYDPVETLDFEGKPVKVYSFANSKLVYISSGENAGYAKGNNLGMRFSKEYFSDEYYLVSNNDIEISKCFDFEEIKDIFDKNFDVAVIGPRIVGLDGVPQSPCNKPSAFGNLVMWHLSMATHDKLFKWNDVDYTKESKKCYRVMGSFMFMRAKAAHEANLFDENTFMYAEEMILSERLLRHGYHVFFYDELTVIHAHGESTGKIADPTIPVEWTFKSLCYYFEKYRNTSKAVLFIGKIVNRMYITLYKVKKRMSKNDS
ncbi:MAG: glycosyltransferase family 2 protein [Butyrivibrio sp.]|nr:glycosyltransferase family 2 protein [Butyrivibrio sp.]